MQLRRVGLGLRLLLLIGIAIAPFVVLLVRDAAEQRRSELEAAYESAVTLARVGVRHQETLIQQARTLIEVVGDIPDVRARDVTSCARYMRAASDRYQWLRNVFMTDAAGNVLCSTRAMARAVNVSDRPYFIRSLETGGFVLSDYIFGRIIGEPILVAASPSYGASGAPAGIIGASIDLSWLVTLTSIADERSGATVLVVDGGGRVLARHPAMPELIGRSIRDEPVWTALSGHSDGRTFAAGLDGVERVYGFARFSHSEARLVVGLPTAPIDVEVSRTLRTRLLFVAGFGIVAFALAFAISDWLVLRPIRALSRATDAIAAGEMNVAAALPSARGELGRLTEGFARMAHALKARERDLIMARREAEGASRVKTEFLAMMSHELRTPLNAIMGFSEIIRDQALGRAAAEKYREYASDIHESGRILLGVINDVVDVAKIETGQVELSKSSVDVAALVDQCVKLIGAQHGGVELVTRIPPGLAPLEVDERRIKQVLLNLLSNAVKFSPAGGRVIVDVEARDGSARALRVIDHGIGIAEEHLAKIFDPFYQVESDLSRRFGGVGLGLGIARALVELHGGALVIESELGAGTTATIFFHRAAEPAEAKGMGALQTSRERLA